MKTQEIIRSQVGIGPREAQGTFELEAAHHEQCPFCSYRLLRIGHTYLCSSCRLPVAPARS